MYVCVCVCVYVWSVFVVVMVRMVMMVAVGGRAMGEGGRHNQQHKCAISAGGCTCTQCQGGWAFMHIMPARSSGVSGRRWQRPALTEDGAGRMQRLAARCLPEWKSRSGQRWATVGAALECVWGFTTLTDSCCGRVSKTSFKLPIHWLLFLLIIWKIMD